MVNLFQENQLNNQQEIMNIPSGMPAPLPNPYSPEMNEMRKKFALGASKGLAVGIPAIPSDILELNKLVNDLTMRYGPESLSKVAQMVQPKVDSLQKKYGREKFDAWVSSNLFESDPSDPGQLTGELASGFIPLRWITKGGQKLLKGLGSVPPEIANFNYDGAVMRTFNAANPTPGFDFGARVARIPPVLQNLDRGLSNLGLGLGRVLDRTSEGLNYMAGRVGQGVMDLPQNIMGLARAGAAGPDLQQIVETAQTPRSQTLQLEKKPHTENIEQPSLLNFSPNWRTQPLDPDVEAKIAQNIENMKKNPKVKQEEIDKMIASLRKGKKLDQSNQNYSFTRTLPLKELQTEGYYSPSIRKMAVGEDISDRIGRSAEYSVKKPVHFKAISAIDNIIQNNSKELTGSDILKLLPKHNVRNRDMEGLGVEEFLAANDSKIVTQSVFDDFLGDKSNYHTKTVTKQDILSLDEELNILPEAYTKHDLVDGPSKEEILDHMLNSSEQLAQGFQRILAPKHFPGVSERHVLRSSNPNLNLTELDYGMITLNADDMYRPGHLWGSGGLEVGNDGWSRFSIVRTPDHIDDNGNRVRGKKVILPEEFQNDRINKSQKVSGSGVRSFEETDDGLYVIKDLPEEKVGFKDLGKAQDYSDQISEIEKQPNYKLENIIGELKSSSVMNKARSNNIDRDKIISNFVADNPIFPYVGRIDKRNAREFKKKYQQKLYASLMNAFPTKFDATEKLITGDAEEATGALSFRFQDSDAAKKSFADYRKKVLESLPPDPSKDQIAYMIRKDVDHFLNRVLPNAWDLNEVDNIPVDQVRKLIQLHNDLNNNPEYVNLVKKPFQESFGFSDSDIQGYELITGNKHDPDPNTFTPILDQETYESFFNKYGDLHPKMKKMMFHDLLPRTKQLKENMNPKIDFSDNVFSRAKIKETITDEAEKNLYEEHLKLKMDHENLSKAKKMNEDKPVPTVLNSFLGKDKHGQVKVVHDMEKFTKALIRGLVREGAERGLDGIVIPDKYLFALGHDVLARDGSILINEKTGKPISLFENFYNDVGGKYLDDIADEMGVNVDEIRLFNKIEEFGDKLKNSPKSTVNQRFLPIPSNFAHTSILAKNKGGMVGSLANVDIFN